MTQVLVDKIIELIQLPGYERGPMMPDVILSQDIHNWTDPVDTECSISMMSPE